MSTAEKTHAHNGKVKTHDSALDDLTVGSVVVIGSLSSGMLGEPGTIAAIADKNAPRKQYQVSTGKGLIWLRSREIGAVIYRPQPPSDEAVNRMAAAYKDHILNTTKAPAETAAAAAEVAEPKQVNGSPAFGPAFLPALVSIVEFAKQFNAAALKQFAASSQPSMATEGPGTQLKSVFYSIGLTPDEVMKMTTKQLLAIVDAHLAAAKKPQSHKPNPLYAALRDMARLSEEYSGRCIEAVKLAQGGPKQFLVDDCVYELCGDHFHVTELERLEPFDTEPQGTAEAKTEPQETGAA